MPGFVMDKRAKPKRRLSEAYKFAGFRARATIREAAGDRGTLIVSLDRRSKSRCGNCGEVCRAGTTVGNGGCAI